MEIDRFYTYQYKFYMIITYCLQGTSCLRGRTIHVKAVQSHPLKVEFSWCVAGKENKIMCCGLTLFLIRICANTGVRIDENSVQEQRSQSHNNNPLVHIFRYRESLGHFITEK